jgi:hypothetical protein
MFGTPESYSLSAVFVISLVALIIKSIDEPPSGHWKIGLLGGITGWTNPMAMFPLVAYGLLILSGTPRARSFGVVALVVLLALAVYWLPSIVGYSSGLDWKLHYFQRRKADFHHLADWRAVLSMFLDFFVFAAVSPYKTIIPNYAAADIKGYFASIVRFAGFAYWVFVLGYALVATLRRCDQAMRISVALLCSLLPLIIFYVYLAPKEGMIFSPFSLVVLFLIVGVGANAFKRARLVMLTLAVLLAAINVRPIYRDDANQAARQVRDAGPLEADGPRARKESIGGD